MNESVNHRIAEQTGSLRPGGAPSAALVVESDPKAGEFLRFALSKFCSFVELAETVTSARELVERYRFDLLVVDGDGANAAGPAWIRQRRDLGDLTPVLILRDDADTESARLLAAIGNTELLARPFSVDQLLARVEQLLRQEPPPRSIAEINDHAKSEATADLSGIVRHSEAMRGLLALIRRVAGRSTTVLLEGESGTGKEVVARCLHQFSGRAGPFVPVNCGSISAELLESELFGHAKGAFTGAAQAREGLFSYADGGTLLLDEIAEMPLHMQAKLLRVLEERAIRPVGTEREIPVDVRIVAATNRNMAGAVAQGNFREDLYYRLNVLALRLPPLRDRVSDIPHLVSVFSSHLSRELALPPLALSPEEIRALQAYRWPGNVRELKNLVERAMLLGESPVDCLGQTTFLAPVTIDEARSETGYPLDMPLHDVERHHTLMVLQDVRGNKSEAARRLGVSRKTLERKVKQWSRGSDEPG